MNVPMTIAITGASIAIGVPLLAGGAALYTQHTVAVAADQAALAAADALNGWVIAVPCDMATRVARKHHARVDSCELNFAEGEVRVTTSAFTLFGRVTGKARAGHTKVDQWRDLDDPQPRTNRQSI
jgi:secretion/DNA translocation related TadE-like protein